MSDRQDLIQSELSGMAFDSLQLVFRNSDVEIMFTQEPPEPTLNAEIFIFIDPAGEVTCIGLFLFCVLIDC